MDYYNTLGVNRSATDDEIKRAYRKKAMEHHPDKGGDEKIFQNINEAYETLKDPQKKQMYDTYGSAGPQQNSFEFRAGDFGGGFEDIFSQMFGGGFQQRRPRGNRQMDVALDLTLEDVLRGKSIAIEVQLHSGRTKAVTVNIPAGVEHGQKIRYAGMGDDTVPNYPPGDLYIHIRVRDHHRFSRQGDNILCEVAVNVLDLILGTKTNVTTLDGRQIEINIPQGTKCDTILSCKGEGLPNVRSRQRGSLYVKIKGQVPQNLTKKQMDKIRDARI